MWEVFYSDGTSVSSEHTTPFGIIHREDVQVIIQDDKKNKWKTITTDYFVWDDRGEGAKWWGCTDIHAVMHYLRQPGSRCVLFGTWIEDADFDKILEEARKAWGKKSGYARSERTSQT
jgi:hypothetical protein